MFCKQICCSEGLHEINQLAVRHWLLIGKEGRRRVEFTLDLDPMILVVYFALIPGIVLLGGHVVEVHFVLAKAIEVVSLNELSVIADGALGLASAESGAQVNIFLH